MPAIPLYTKVPEHPGSSEHEILNEPDWAKTHSHRIGFRDRENRYPGFTHLGDERKREAEFEEGAKQREDELRAKIAEGALVTVRDFMRLQEVRRPY
jgi:nitrate reductase (NAD(P)H)